MPNEHKPFDTPWIVVEAEKYPETFNIYGKSGNRIAAYCDLEVAKVIVACVNAQAINIEEYSSLSGAAKRATALISEISDKLKKIIEAGG